MNPETSRIFIRDLYRAALLWLGIGILATFSVPDALNAFVQVYFVTALDLVFLILLFWTLFFYQGPRANKAMRSMIFFTFKLVCLGLLAITLKRLRNAPSYSVVMGVLFIAIGPLFAACLVGIRKGNQDRATKF